MAEIPFVVEPVIAHSSGAVGHGCYLVKWETLGTGDFGAPYFAPDYPDKSMQAAGDFTGGGNVAAEVSNHNILVPTAWAIAKDPQGDPIALAVAGDISAIQPNSVAVRPFVVGTVADVDVYLLVTTTARR